MYVSVPFRHRIPGRGLGGILTNLRHLVKPIFHKTKDIFLKPLANEGINFLSSAAKEVIEGKNTPSQALKNNLKKSKKRLTKKGKKIVKNLAGKKKKTVKGSGGKKGKGKKKKASSTGKSKKKKTKGRPPKKRANKKTVSSQKSIFDDYI